LGFGLVTRPGAIVVGKAKGGKALVNTSRCPLAGLGIKEPGATGAPPPWALGAVDRAVVDGAYQLATSIAKE
jgi:hypothetical protein